MSNLVSAILIASLFSAPVLAYTGPGKPATKTANATLWKKYCVGDPDGADAPKPKYTNAKVKEAADILSKQVAPLSFYFYTGPVRAYGLDSKAKSPPEGTPKGVTVQANIFLTVLCGEFRDRATMVEAKLNWVQNLYKLPVTKQKKEVDYNKSIWSQFSAHSYLPYLEFSKALYDERKEKAGTVDITSGIELDKPVVGQTVCETKYIIGEYIAKGDEFPGLKEFEAGLKKFTHCTADDKAHYYDFRGDSNFKPNSPESNGMIWYSSSITNHCKTTDSAKDKIKDEDCVNYFTSPFKSRWNAARAGLATWLFHAQKHTETFQSEGEKVIIHPQINKFDSPFSFTIEDKEYKDFLSEWTAAKKKNMDSPDIGFNAVTGLGGKGKVDFKLAYARLMSMVNRHTDWYSSAYDDGMGMARDQAYSPFVASSYEMSASDGFTSPGATVNSPSDGKKHWMFVFKIPKENWYTSMDIKNEKGVNFDTMWFDETTLGTNDLAKTERAWDRLGTALETELDSIIYLHNITEDGDVEADDLKQ